MASYKIRPTRNWDPEDEQPTEAETEQIGVPDTRKLVEDTTKYPFNAVALIESEYFSDFSEFTGTGFLCENYLLITCAHNVRNDYLQPADEVIITFGLNGKKDHSNKKQIVLEGCDFTVPENYKRHTDHCDIAWVNLKLYHQQNHPIRWTLTDLPNESFLTCSIPDKDGKFDKFIIGNLSLCGKKVNVYIHIINIIFTQLEYK